MLKWASGLNILNYRGQSAADLSVIDQLRCGGEHNGFRHSLHVQVGTLIVSELDCFPTLTTGAHIDELQHKTDMNSI